MSHFDYKQFYKRNRPHIHPPGAVLFVTFRLAGSVPQSTLKAYRLEKASIEKALMATDANNSGNLEFHRHWFKTFEEVLHKAQNGPIWLGHESIRKIVTEKLLEDDKVKYRLDAFCVMSNHAHVVFQPNLSDRNLIEKLNSGHSKFISEEETLAEIMQSLKGVTARKANLKLGRAGAFWEKESYDHFVRDEEEFNRVIRYTLNNPVKAGLVKHWSEWPGNFLAERLRKSIKLQFDENGATN